MGTIGYLESQKGHTDAQDVSRLTGIFREGLRQAEGRKRAVNDNSEYVRECDGDTRF